MKRMFIFAKFFDLSWKENKFSDDDQRRLEQELLENPRRGSTIRGTGGVRKYRFAAKGKGKRGGARIGYKDYPEFEIIHLFFVYTKDNKTDLTQKEKSTLKQIINTTDKILEAKYGKKK